MAKPSFPGVKPLTGEVDIPGDKSISHRALIFAALSQERSEISGLGPGDDIAATRDALVAMGAKIGSRGSRIGGTCTVEGFGVGGAIEPDKVLDVRNSGTALRTLLPECASGRGNFTLRGDETLNRRPMLRVVTPLRAMGATIDGRAGGEFAPLIVTGRPLHGASHRLEQASAQVKTALLLAGLAAAGETRVQSPAPSRDHTERMLASLGVVVEGDILEQRVHGPVTLPGNHWRVPADPSSAMFLIAAATLIEGSSILIPHVSLNPYRIGAFEILKNMGGLIEWEVTGHWHGEPVGTVSVRSSELRGVDIPAEVVPSLIDELPILGILALFASGRTTVVGAGELRVKESDRITSLTEGLRAIGGSAEPLPDGFTVEGGPKILSGAVDSHGDHRIAMSFAVAGLAAGEKITVRGWDSVDTSFPGFHATVTKAQGG